MILHDAPETFLDLVDATAGHFGIPAVYVEKDYWVTLALKRLHQSDFKEQVVFKGGTALSKAHRLIKRFSEDIDLAIRPNDMGDAKRKRLLKQVETALTQDLTYQAAHPMESKGSRFRKTAYAYPMRTDASQLGQVSDIILLEINAFADPEPAERMDIGTLISDFLATQDRLDLIGQYRLAHFDIFVLSVERTLCEKMMSLVRTGYEPNAKTDFARRIRHFYDIAMILRQPCYQEFVASNRFAGMISAVKASDRASMPNAEVWLDQPIEHAPIFANTKNLWNDLKMAFHNNFKGMVYGDEMPDDREILMAIRTLKVAINNMAADEAKH